MAIIDKDKGVIVIRIVYAGMPKSGKTETLKTLSALLHGKEKAEKEFYSPDETNGRTLYFDWVNYVGGHFQGLKIDCQIISVPGQKTLYERRKLLLKMADVVVYVIDSQKDKLESCLEYYREMQPWLKREHNLCAGVLLQANKRDIDNAASLEDIKSIFSDAGNLMVLETVATGGNGIRETFVTAVKLGLENASWLIQQGEMPDGTPELADGEALLNKIQKKERSIQKTLNRQKHNTESRLDTASGHPSAGGQAQSVLHFDPITDNDWLQTSGPHGDGPKLPALPGKDLPSGSVFPPATGRIILYKLSAEPVTDYAYNADAWQLKLGSEWRLQSRTGDRFSNFGDAQLSLTRYASTHTLLEDILSEQRCSIIVKQQHEDQWCLWQAVKKEKSLHEALTETLMYTTNPQRIAERFYIFAEKFLAAYQTYTGIGSCSFDFSPETLSLQNNKLVFSGFLDENPDIENHNHYREPLELLKSSFGPIVNKSLKESETLSLNIPYIIHPLNIYAKNAGDDKKQMIDTLRTLFIGEH